MYVPAWPETGVKQVWGLAMEIESFKSYIPDDWTRNQKTERKFFYGILSTMSSDFVKALVDEATELRHAHHLTRERHVESMQITQEWAEALLAQPFRPCEFIFHLFKYIFSFLYSQWAKCTINYGSDSSTSSEANVKTSPTGLSPSS